MNYSTIEFFLFVGIAIFAYFLFPVKKYKWTVLLAASYFFYLFAGYQYAVFIVFTTLSTYGVGLCIAIVK